MRGVRWAWVAVAVVCAAGWARAGDDDDVKDVPAQEVTLGKDQKYVLIGDVNGDAPKGLLVVMPGGDGSAEFGPFVKRIQQNALPEGYLVAQMVAVPAKPNSKTTWPTAKATDPKQAFTTEEFLAKVVADAKQKAKIDDARVMGLGWSSSGLAEYATAARKDTPVKKWFVAMSVFHPGEMADFSALKGQKFYLLHSPDDKTCPIGLATTAKARLEKAGAEVKFAEYQGGHGWHGDVFGNIRAGVEWLEKGGEK
jgi:predicted esterase